MSSIPQINIPSNTWSHAGRIDLGGIPSGSAVYPDWTYTATGMDRLGNLISIGQVVDPTLNIPSTAGVPHSLPLVTGTNFMIADNTTDNGPALANLQLSLRGTTSIPAGGPYSVKVPGNTTPYYIGSNALVIGYYNFDHINHTYAYRIYGDGPAYLNSINPTIFDFHGSASNAGGVFVCNPDANFYFGIVDGYSGNAININFWSSLTTSFWNKLVGRWIRLFTDNASAIPFLSQKIFAESVSTTLVTGMTSGDQTFTVVNPTGFPPSSQWPGCSANKLYALVYDSTTYTNANSDPNCEGIQVNSINGNIFTCSRPLAGLSHGYPWSGPGAGATATAQINSFGNITGIVGGGGTRYYDSVGVTLHIGGVGTGGAGSGSVVGTAVSSYVVTNSGTGYTSVPPVTVNFICPNHNTPGHTYTVLWSPSLQTDASSRTSSVGYMQNLLNQWAKVTGIICSGVGVSSNQSPASGIYPSTAVTLLLDRNMPWTAYNTTMQIFFSEPTGVGYENFTIQNIATNGIVIGGNSNWIKNVESSHCYNYHFSLDNCSSCQIEQCYVHQTAPTAYDVRLGGPGNSSYGTWITNLAGENLVWNNIYYWTRHWVAAENGNTCNVIAYNASFYEQDNAPTNYLYATVMHGCNMWNLYEGNVCSALRFDAVLGA